MTREHRQAYMEAFGADMLMDDYREQTAELSQEFAEFGAATLKSMGWSKYGWADYQKKVDVPEGQLAASLHRVEGKWDDPDAKGWFWRVEFHRKGSSFTEGRTMGLHEGYAATATKAGVLDGTAIPYEFYLFDTSGSSNPVSMYIQYA